MKRIPTKTEMVVSFTLLVLVASAASQAYADAPPAAVKRPMVVVISVDGLGAHLLASMPTRKVPTFTKLAESGDQAIRAETISKAQTIPGHASMLSGVDTLKHQQVENELGPGLKAIKVKTIFDLVKANGLTSAAYFGKAKLSFLFETGAIDVSANPRQPPFGDWWARWPSIVTSTVSEIIRRDRPDFLFVHYALIDTVGHIFQWESAAQREAIRKVDQSVGELFSVLDSVSVGSHDGYVVILTADHGGNAGSHGHTKPNGELESVESDLVIPWIVSTSQNSSRRVSLVNPKNVVKIYDTAASAAFLLDLKVPKEWQWDGTNRLKFTSK